MLLNEVKLEQKKESVKMPRQAFNNIKGISITGVQHETVTATVWARGALPYPLLRNTSRWSLFNQTVIEPQTAQVHG